MNIDREDGMQFRVLGGALFKTKIECFVAAEQYYYLSRLSCSQLLLHLLHQFAESSRLLVPFSLGKGGDAGM